MHLNERQDKPVHRTTVGMIRDKMYISQPAQDCIIKYKKMSAHQAQESFFPVIWKSELRILGKKVPYAVLLFIVLILFVKTKCLNHNRIDTPLKDEF